MDRMIKLKTDYEYFLVNKKYFIQNNLVDRCKSIDIEMNPQLTTYIVDKSKRERHFINEDVINELSSLEEMIEYINRLTEGNRFINTVDRSYHSLLYYLVKCDKSFEAIEYLLKKGASFENDMSKTPIIFVCKTIKMIEFCVDNGCNINATNHWGKNIANKKYDDSNINLLKFYVSKGVSLIDKSNIRTIYSENIFSTEIISVIFSLCSDEERKYYMYEQDDRYLLRGCSDFDKKVKRFEMLLKYGFDVNYIHDNKSFSMLNMLIDRIDIKMIRYLLANTDVKCDIEHFKYFGSKICKMTDVTNKQKKRVLNENINIRHIDEILGSDYEKYITYRHIAQLMLYKATHLVSTTKSAAKLI